MTAASCRPILKMQAVAQGERGERGGGERWVGPVSHFSFHMEQSQLRGKGWGEPKSSFLPGKHVLGDCLQIALQV